MQLRCEECGKVAEADAKGWRAFLGVGLEDDHASDCFVCVFARSALRESSEQERTELPRFGRVAR